MSLGINALDPKDRKTYIHPDPNLHPLGICQFCGISVYPHPYRGRYVWQAFPGQPHHHPMCVTEDTENIIIDNVDWVEKIKSIATPPPEGHGGGTGGKGGKGGKGGTGHAPVIGQLPSDVSDIYKSGVLNISGYATVPVAEDVLFGDLITSYKDRIYATESIFGPRLGIPKATCGVPDGIHLFQFRPEKYNRVYLFGSIFSMIDGMGCYINIHLLFADKNERLLRNVVDQCFDGRTPIAMVAACTDFYRKSDVYIDWKRKICRVTYEGMIHSRKMICACAEY